MTDAQCITFLRWCLPQLGFRWEGFRKVRRQVWRRIQKRMVELSIDSSDRYMEYLLGNPDEWERLRLCCRVTISRFYRDRAVFNALRWDILPDLARRAIEQHRRLGVWSCGCASGEEPYTVGLIWDAMELGSGRLEITATDLDCHLLERAAEGSFSPSSLREIPETWRKQFFDIAGGQFKIRNRLKEPIRWLQQDILKEVPPGPFDLVLCRYLVFTYFDDESQRRTLERIARVMKPGGVLVIGQIESLPSSGHFEPFHHSLNIFART